MGQEPGEVMKLSLQKLTLYTILLLAVAFVSLIA